ncbi:MAG: hypothetical protein RJA15_1411, partial [Actinomycetota bacterium]
MLKSHRKVARFAAGVLAVSILAACGGGAASSDATNPDGSATSDPAANAEPVYPLLGTPITDAA